jgi:hypothetical protein
MGERADAPASDQRLGADARECRDGVGAATQERQWRDNHSRAQYAEYHQDAFDDVGQLDADNSVGRQSHVAQPPGDRRDHAVGFGIGEAAWFAVGEGLAVRRIRKCECIGTPLCMAAEDLVDGDAARAVRWLGCCERSIAEDHCSARFA